MSQSIGRKVSVLLSGSVAAQALPVLAAPILTRLYTPDSFGQFGIFTAAATILAAFANLKYDHAILLARTQATASHLLLVCISVSTTLASLLGLIALLTPTSWWNVAGFLSDPYSMGCLPINFFLQAVLQAMGAMMFRQEMFASVAKIRIGQALVTTSLSLLFGILMPAGHALIAATLLGQITGVAMTILFSRKVAFFPDQIHHRLFFACAARYRRFPMFTTPSDFLNAMGANLPMLFVGNLYGVAAAGALTMAQRTLGTPLMLVGSAFSDAYRQSAAKSVSEIGNYWQVAAKTVRILSLLAILPALLCVCFSQTLFPIIFGQRWVLAGALIQVMSVAYFLRLVVSPLSYNYYLAERHSEDLILQCISFGLTVLIFLLSKNQGFGFIATLLMYSVACAFVYLVYGLRSMYFASMSRTKPTVTASVVSVR